VIKNRIVQGGLILSLVILLIFIVAAPVLAYSYAGVRWSANYASYDVSGISNASWRTAIHNAAATWTNAGANFFFYSSSSSSNDWGTINLGNVSTLARTLRYTSSGYIVECDVQFNTYYSFYTDGSDYDVEDLALHEFGHWLALNDVTLAFWKVMYQYYVWIKHDLSDDEVSGIIYIYGSD